MGKTPKLAYLWPGLSQVWGRGTWSGLAMAVGFAVLFNLTLVASLIWSELFTPEIRRMAWGAVAVVWIGWAILGFGWDRHDEKVKTALAENDVFGEAQRYYLQGNWFETERLLRHLLRGNPRDVDARLMLATLLRHLERFEEAAEQLDRLGRTEGSQKWETEIGRERAFLAEAWAARPESPEPVANPEIAGALDSSASMDPAMEKEAA